MASFFTWAAANWQPILLDLIAADTALIALFPNAGILRKFGNWLASVKSAI